MAASLRQISLLALRKTEKSVLAVPKTIPAQIARNVTTETGQFNMHYDLVSSVLLGSIDIFDWRDCCQVEKGHVSLGVSFMWISSNEKIFKSDELCNRMCKIPRKTIFKLLFYPRYSSNWMFYRCRIVNLYC